MELKKILFVTYGGGHVNMIVPIAKELMGYEGVDIEVLGLTTARDVLECESVPCFSFRDLPLSSQARNWGGRLLCAGLKAHPLVPYEESLAYMGLSYQCLVEQYGEDEASDLYEREGRQSFLPVGVMERIIRDGDYDLVVATNSPRAERAAIIAADNLGVQSLCVVDLFALQEVEWIGKKGYANKICVFSDYVKELIVRSGRDNKDVIVTGNPAFDRLADSSLAEKSKSLKVQKGWVDKKLILWCSQIEPEYHPFTGEPGDKMLPEKVLAELANVCDKHEDWHLLVRRHPSELISGLAETMEDCSCEELTVLLSASDLVVTLSSTVALEAYLLGRAVVTVDMSIFTKDAPFSDMGISYGVKELASIEGTLDLLLADAYVLKEVPLPKVGKGAWNVCHEIVKLLNEE